MTTTAPQPDQILQTGTGFWASKTLLSAVEMEVFTELAKGPEDLHTLTGRLGLHPRSSRELTVPEFAAVLDAYEADLRTEGVDFPELEQPW